MKLNDNSPVKQRNYLETKNKTTKDKKGKKCA